MPDEIIEIQELAKQKALGEVSEIIEDDRVIWFKASTNVIDRTGDIIDVTGWQLDMPIEQLSFLPFHDYDEFPWGKLIGHKITDALYIGVKFAPASINPDAEIAYQMYRNKYMTMVSVGFKPVEYELIKNADGRITGYHFKRQTLLELSGVTVPANHEASMIMAASFDKATKDYMKDKYLPMIEDLLTFERVKESVPFMGIQEIEELQKMCDERIKAYDDEVKAETLSTMKAIFSDVQARIVGKK